MKIDVKESDIPKIMENVIQFMYKDLTRVIYNHLDDFIQNDLKHIQFRWDYLGSLPNPIKYTPGNNYARFKLEASVLGNPNKTIQLL